MLSRRLLVKAVEKLGYCALPCADGQQAWETLQENPDVTLVITDMMMPEMTGEELLKVIRGDQQFVELPVIMISGVVGRKQIEDILELGVSRFMRKPISIAELRDYLEKFTTKA